MEAAVATVQFARMPQLIRGRACTAYKISNALRGLEDLAPAVTLPRHHHTFYLQAIRVTNENLPGMFLSAVKREGIPATRYVKPLYRLPIYQHLWGEEKVREIRDSCPVTERCYKEVIVHPFVHAGMTDPDVEDVIVAFRKVHRHRDEL
jgi:dTDP-4-amino-4,6-dideoxygalactose transaminase